MNISTLEIKYLIMMEKLAYIFAKKLDLKVGEEKSYIVKVVGFKDKKMEDY